LKVFIGGISLPVQIGLNHKDRSIKTGFFAVFSSLGLVQSWSFPVLVRSSLGLFPVLRLDLQTLPPTNPSPPLENPAVTPGEDDGEGMLVDESVEREPKKASKEPNEIERILDELADGIPEPTLVRLSEEGVALDMDEVVVDVIDEEDSESPDSDEDSEESSK